MAGWRQAVALAMTGEEIEALTALSRSRTEPAGRVSRAAMLLGYRETMSRTETIVKNLREVGEAEYTKMVTCYAKTVHPTLTKEQAFCKVFEAPDAEGRAIRSAWVIAKGGSVSGPMDEDDVDDANDEIEGDAMDQLDQLAGEERRRNPSLSKAQAFAKVYSDNPKLAARERVQNKPRA
jgi:hypothetical protein